MTTDEFQSRYRLLKLIAAGETTSYHAVASTGPVVMAHFLGAPDGPHSREVLARVDRLPPAERSRVLNVLEVDGSSVLVTKFLLGVDTLGAWLDAHSGELPPAQDSPPSPAPSASAPGAYTRLFKATPPVSGPPEPLPPSPPATSQEPGAFTRAFRVPAPPPTPPSLDRVGTPFAASESRTSPPLVQEPAWNGPVQSIAPLPEPPEPRPQDQAQEPPGQFTQLLNRMGNPVVPSARPVDQPGAPASSADAPIPIAPIPHLPPSPVESRPLEPVATARVPVRTLVFVGFGSVLLTAALVLLFLALRG